jgi:hypothetical protein
MTRLLAHFGLLFVGMGCFWIAGRTPPGTYRAVDGTFMLVGLGFIVAAIVGILRAAF